MRSVIERLQQEIAELKTQNTACWRNDLGSLQHETHVSVPFPVLTYTVRSN